MGRMFDTPVLPRLSELFEEVRDGTIRVPAFQRGYVWSDDKRLRLMDSIWRGIPIGSLLVWRTTTDQGMTTVTHIGPSELPAASASNVRGYLVDGLQRVTTLFAALMPLTKGMERDPEGRRWPIYFELDPSPGDDLRFHLARRSQVSPTWMPLSCVLDDDEFFAFRTRLVDGGHRHLLEEARRLESRFRDYVVPVVPLVSDDPSLVAEAFTRVNSLGQDMDEGDMAHALTFANSFDFNEELARISEQLSPFGWEKLSRKTIINALKAIWDLDIYKAGAKGIQHELMSADGRGLLHEFSELFDSVAQVLRSFGVYGPGSLPYAYQLVALIRAAHRVRPWRLGTEKTVFPELRRWFFWTTYVEHFTGMTSGRLRLEFDLVERLIRGDRKFDWIPTPSVTPITKLRANAVRSRVAILVMAIAGDRSVAAGSDRQQRLYGALGTDALRRIFPDQSSLALANRVLTEDDELKSLRDWAGAPTSEVSASLESLLRRNLMMPLESAQLTTSSVLQLRTTRLHLEEQKFVEDLGGTWNPGVDDDQ